MKTRSQFKIYARQEPTTDSTTLQNFHPISAALCFDTVYYANRNTRKSFLARKPWYQSDHPRKTGVQKNLNCVPRTVIMLPKLKRRPKRTPEERSGLYAR